MPIDAELSIFTILFTKKIENFYPKCDKNKIMKSIEDIISYKINFKLTKAR